MEAEKLNYKEREVFQLGGADRVVLAHHLSESGKTHVMMISRMRMMQTIIVRVIMMLVMTKG